MPDVTFSRVLSEAQLSVPTSVSQAPPLCFHTLQWNRDFPYLASISDT